MKKYSAIVIGAGCRGIQYTNIMILDCPDKFEVVAVAEKTEARRNYIKEKHGLDDSMCFEDWEDILSKPKMADLCIISTMDDLHYAPAMKAIELGYDILLEKPVAPTVRECIDIATAAEKKGVKVLVCHVLRYTDFYTKVKEIVMSGEIGEIMSVIAVEAVGDIHQSHSYVRGNWHSEAETTPMLLAKSCHDLDIIQWIVDKPCKKISSFGDLTYFKEENAPEGSPVRCIDGGCPIEDTCPYNCKKLYYDRKNDWWLRGVCTRGIAKVEGAATDEEVMTALKTTDFGLCVYHANNDVVDHQVVNMEFEGGCTASFTMNAFNEGGRYIRLFGTKGELYASASDSEITVYTFADRKRRAVHIEAANESIVAGHGGGDNGIIRELYDYLADTYTGFRAADISTSVKNHLIGFAAEKARHADTVEDVDKFFSDNGYVNKY